MGEEIDCGEKLFGKSFLPAPLFKNFGYEGEESYYKTKSFQ